MSVDGEGARRSDGLALWEIKKKKKETNLGYVMLGEKNIALI